MVEPKQRQQEQQQQQQGARYSAKGLPPLPHGRCHFLHLDDFSADELRQMLNDARSVKARLMAMRDPSYSQFKREPPYEPFNNLTLAMVFSKASLRTRVSFQTGFELLGGSAFYLAPEEHKIGKREPPKDVARVLCRYNDAIMARLAVHEDLLELARYSQAPVLNGLTDYNHPCQVLSDAFTIQEKLGKFEGVKVAFVGNGNNVVHSWLRLACRLSFEFVLACPEGYEPDAMTLQAAKEAGISRVSVTHDPFEAVQGADVVYTDVWASMGQEDQLEERRKRFKGFTVTKELMAAAKPSAMYMHCLPAQRGNEVTDEVIEGPQSVVFEQAENRMHVQAAIMLHCLAVK